MYNVSNENIIIIFNNNMEKSIVAYTLFVGKLKEIGILFWGENVVHT